MGELHQHSEVLGAALSYLGRGFAIVPQRPGDKKPCVRWKAYQVRLPTREEMTDWLTHQFPEAGLAVVLGPVSNLFVIDVDGPEAHAELIARLGSEPIAPKVLSGSGKPYRYHLFFRHPGIETRAKITPWHPNLEFRGHRGIVVLPPSLHKSGKRYEWAPGQSLDDFPLPDLPAPVLEALVERAAKDAVASAPPSSASDTPTDLADIQRRARAYLAKLPPAIEGQGGDKQTFIVACRLVRGFGLSPDDALPLLQEYNQRCQPQWMSNELRHKLDEANKWAGARGNLALGEDAAPTPLEDPAPVSTEGVPFHGCVPDFVLADWWLAGPKWWPRLFRARQRRTPVGRGLAWAIHLAVIAQRSPFVVVPDVMLGQVLWGGDRQQWPRNWRQFILRTLQSYSHSLLDVSYQRENRCPELCTLHHSPVRHRHLLVTIKTERDLDDSDRLNEEGKVEEDAWLCRVFLGVLELFGFGGPDELRQYDLTLRTQRQQMNEETFKALKTKISRYRSRGRLLAIYFPLRLFGLAPRVGLSVGQRKLLMAITRELTRDKKSSRPDKAQLIIPGKAASDNALCTVDHPPELQIGKRYVGFNGNGGRRLRRLHGRGYRILGQYSWPIRAMYIPDSETETLAQVRRFLKDLMQVSSLFGLIVAGRHRRTGEWLGLADLLDRTRSPAGCKWLSQCVLRIYTEEDYLRRWRKFFADRMGFSVIPDRDQEPKVVATPSASPVQLMAYLRKAGVSRQELARSLGVSESLLSQYMNGHKDWSMAWQARVEAWVAAREQGRG